jgi:hypothetical protein
VSTVTQCDQCRQIFVPPFNGYYDTAEPVFRLTINFGISATPNERMALTSSVHTHDFCSRACLMQYLDGLDEKGRLKMVPAPGRASRRDPR